MLFSEFYQIMVNNFTFLGFRREIAPIAFLDPPPIQDAVASHSL